MGRDRIDHPAGAHDDLSNAAAGALVLAGEESSYWRGNMAWVGDPELTPYGQKPIAQHPYFGGVLWLALR
jgi:hypothetical protein